MDISQKIIDYAIWYYLKYYPSPKKMEFKLVQKFGINSENGKKYGGIGKDEIEFILKEKMKNIIQEEEVIKSKIRSYKNKGKSRIYIKQKLFERMEDKDLIDIFLEKEFIDGEMKNIETEYNKMKGKIEKQKIIEKLFRKGFRYDDIKKVVG